MSKKEKIIDEIKNKKLSKNEIAKKCNATIRYVNKIIFGQNVDNKLFESEKVIQKLRDQQRIERKIKREDYRKYNASDNYLSEIAKQIKKFEIPELKIHKNKNKNKNKYLSEDEYEGIFQLSDIHFNEIISDLSENKYDFEIASKRLKSFVTEAIKIFKQNFVKKILIAMTGDVLGSDRRIDEKLNQATNRSKATIIGTFLLEQVIRELNAHFDIKIAMVAGNESRVFELSSSDIVFSDNYDFMLYNLLKMIFRKNLNMFIDSENENIYRKIVKIKNKNILLLHGHNLGKNPELDVTKLIGQISASNDIPIDYVLFGHIHQCQISDFYARSSSLSGGNAYSTNQLKLISKASQNIHLISEKSIHSIKIDLQDTSGIMGYPINNDFYIHKSNGIKKLIYRF